MLPPYSLRFVRADEKGRSVRAGNPPLCNIPTKSQRESRRSERRVTSPQTLRLGCLNVRGCSTLESKRCEIGGMFCEKDGCVSSV